MGVSGNSDSLLELQPTWYKDTGLLSYNIDVFEYWPLNRSSNVVSCDIMCYRTMNSLTLTGINTCSGITESYSKSGNIGISQFTSTTGQFKINIFTYLLLGAIILPFNLLNPLTQYIGLAPICRYPVGPTFRAGSTCLSICQL